MSISVVTDIELYLDNRLETQQNTVAEKWSVRHLVKNILDYPYISGGSATMGLIPTDSNSIISLGWTVEEARETYFRLSSFEEDWNHPGMEVYDDF
ncbi:MAG: hypothetical protein H3C47_15280 [Candidatus Cloacimonetes bacterium]|nr:hypothetical protein [Candidatus Cloacimonadota bacterium]